MLLSFWFALAAAVDVPAVLQGELTAALTALKAEADPPYYVALAVDDHEEINIGALDGALSGQTSTHLRYLDVDVRTGTPELDSTHLLRGFSSLDDDDRDTLLVPYGGPGEESALRFAVSREIDARYRQARESIELVRGEELVRVEEEDPAPDFEVRPPVVASQEVAPIAVDEEAWSQLLVELSGRLITDPHTGKGRAWLEVYRDVYTLVDSDGTRLVHGLVRARVGLVAETVADDGDEVNVFEAFDVHDPASLPPAEQLRQTATRLADRLTALRAAPRVGPYTGPVLLSGKAAAVFFHEVMGHRVEGQRQKSDDEGKTFLEYVGKPVLPAWIDVYDDPTIAHMAGADLNGWYGWDDQGVPAQRATLVDHGIFQGFLMGRAPLADFPHSNGHGRRSPGHVAVSRMANTIVEARQKVSMDAIRAQLRKEAAAQGQAFGYYVEEIQGGFTMTGRVIPNAFNVRASVTWRVYVDGRPDELVRGIDLVGTPLVAFQSIVAAAGEPEVFNGVCGAESGWVPVSGVAPAILFKRLEFQLKEKESQRPPLLAPPALPMGSARREVTP
jgi:TldD protein